MRPALLIEPGSGGSRCSSPFGRGGPDGGKNLGNSAEHLNQAGARPLTVYGAALEFQKAETSAPLCLRQLWQWHHDTISVGRSLQEALSREGSLRRIGHSSRNPSNWSSMVRDYASPVCIGRSLQHEGIAKARTAL